MTIPKSIGIKSASGYGDIAYRLQPGDTSVTADDKVSIRWYERW
jgi:hypothetical protein